MYKLVVLTCLFAIAAAKPGYLEHHGLEHHGLEHHGLQTVSVHSEVPVVKTALVHEPSYQAVQEHTIEKIGEHVEHIPTAVSHQSQTIVHSGADKITPILAPAVKTHYAPAVRTYEKQYIENVPVVESYNVAPTIVKSYAAAPVAYTSGYATSYAASPYLHSSIGHHSYHHDLPVISHW